MKKIALLLILITTSLSAQSFLTYDCSTFDFIGYSYTTPTSGCYTTVPFDLLRCFPKFNTTTQKWYESGNTAQLEECYTFNDFQTIEIGQQSFVNPHFTVLKTDTQLNYYYGDVVPPFQLFCPNTPYPNFTGASVTYIKITPTKWRRSFSTDNQP